MNSRHVVITADDLNHSPCIDEAILWCAEHRLITSTSVIVNTPISDSLVEDCQRLSKRISFGLHFNLSRYQPVAPTSRIESLISTDGAFLCEPSLAGFLERLQTVPHQAIEHELEAQLERFFEYFGFPPSHIDSHHYAHSTDPVRPVVLKRARALGVSVRRPERPGGKRYSAHTSSARIADAVVFVSSSVADPIEAFANALSQLTERVTEVVIHPTSRTILENSKPQMKRLRSMFDALRHDGVRFCRSTEIPLGREEGKAD